MILWIYDIDSTLVSTAESIGVNTLLEEPAASLTDEQLCHWETAYKCHKRVFIIKDFQYEKCPEAHIFPLQDACTSGFLNIFSISACILLC